ncbi:MAG: hypothetical protein ACFFC3_11125 [Candidatus Odinarchaeota archaeon]
MPIYKVFLNPKERARLENKDYRQHPKYIGIKTTMSMYGQYHAITLRKKGDMLVLLGGFLRFCIVVELRWTNIEVKIYP